MSLILDALRKIELERKAKRQSSQEVRSEVLNYQRLTPPAEKSRIIPVAVVLMLVSTAVACFFYLQKPQSSKKDSLSQKESLIQPMPVIPQQMPQLQQPASALPTQKSPQAVEESPAQTVKPSTGAVKQGVGDGITVSGIAWQDERSLRRAVINGFLVGEGAEIQGATIVEIKENRVRFSRGGEIFEVVHTSGTGK